MRGSSSTAVFRSKWLLIGSLLLVATGCAIAPPRDGTAPAVVAPTPTLDALDPCASARTNRSTEPNSAQAVALADFIRWSRFPVRDARSLPIINDGAFARVVVCAQVRHGLTDVWDEFSGEYALAFTRDQWSVQKSPLDRMDGFVSVKAEATRQAAEQAATEKVQAALSARTAISATVVGITEVRDIPADSSYSKVTLELQSTDGKQHTVVFWPNFRATMRQCATKSLEGAESIMSISGLFSAQPKETIGREPIQRDYAFKAAQNPWHGVFARPNCQILTDARDLKLTIDQIDGFEAYRLEAAARQLADATATPIPVPTVLAVATEVLPSPTMIVSVEPAPATASGGVSLPDFSPVLFVVPVALIAAVVLGRTLLVRRVSWSRAAPRHSRAEEPRVMDASAPEPGEQHAERATEASVHPVGDTGPVVATPVGVTLSAVSAPLVVKCFGALHVAHADRVLWPSREFAHEQRAWELLFFLAASPSEGVDRELVGAALWPEVDLADVAGLCDSSGGGSGKCSCALSQAYRREHRWRPTPAGSIAWIRTWYAATRTASRLCCGSRSPTMPQRWEPWSRRTGYMRRTSLTAQPRRHLPGHLIRATTAPVSANATAGSFWTCAGHSRICMPQVDRARTSNEGSTFTDDSSRRIRWTSEPGELF